MDSLQKVAERLLGLFELQIRDEGTRDEESFWVFKSEAFGTDDYERLSDLMRDMDVSMDFAYEETHSALEDIDEYGEEYDDRAIYERSEADVYTHDLMKWMSSHLSHKEYVDEVLRKCGGDVNDMDALIMHGQSRAKEMVRRKVLELVEEIVEKEEDFDGTD